MYGKTSIAAATTDWLKNGYILPEGKCCHRLGAPKRTAVSYCCNRDHKLFGSPNVLLRTFPVYTPRTGPVACQASPNNHRRNPDFSRQHKGSSRGKNRQNQDREQSDNLDEADLLATKNGPLLSFSGNQRYSATATPGRREKEIVELFRKVQAQLRERAAIKEEKKVEASQQGQGDRGTVDSLLKLLRKHSVAQGKKSGGEEDNLDQRERSTVFEEEHNSNFFSSDNIAVSDDVTEPDPVPHRRPASSFRRRSPVPRVKFQPILAAEENSSSNSSFKSQGMENTSIDDQESGYKNLKVAGEISSADLSDSSAVGEIIEETVESSGAEGADLATMKLAELRVIAKSRGVKGYSKLKKGELVGILSGDGA